MLFETGATVTVGGVPATDVDVTDAPTITATTPALPAGTVNDVVVTNPSGPGRHAHQRLGRRLPGCPPRVSPTGWVRRLVRADITAGVGCGNYGPDHSTLRQRWPSFFSRLSTGSAIRRPPARASSATCPRHFAPWIEALAAEGITGGCGGDNYCPASPVLRQQMAGFLLKAKHGSNYLPPPCDGGFVDVPCPRPLRRLDRAARRRGHHRRLRRGQLLPGPGRHPRPDGRVPGAHVPSLPW